MQQMGITDCVVDSINFTPQKYQAHLLNNIRLVGGNTCIPGYPERMSGSCENYRRLESFEGSMSFIFDCQSPRRAEHDEPGVLRACSVQA
eukprot:m.517772 g.517772  ORF g.517772 m.517772 type:complete len:90 (+) comp57481_c1_seq13:906-1175(+)